MIASIALQKGSVGTLASRYSFGGSETARADVTFRNGAVKMSAKPRHG